MEYTEKEVTFAVNITYSYKFEKLYFTKNVNVKLNSPEQYPVSTEYRMKKYKILFKLSQ
jgi:hypothetical protein